MRVGGPASRLGLSAGGFGGLLGVLGRLPVSIGLLLLGTQGAPASPPI
jgi:hypothetical protein